MPRNADGHKGESGEVGDYSPTERAALAAAARAGGKIRCPACGGAVVRHDIDPRSDVGYVRRRVLLICGGCGRRAALDVPRPDS